MTEKTLSVTGGTVGPPNIYHTKANTELEETNREGIHFIFS